MSTRATIHFVHKKGDKPAAIVYRHGDGYPDGLGKDLQDFFREVKRQCEGGMGGCRFDDPYYLSAKWVVWDAGQMAKYSQSFNKPDAVIQPLNFLSVGIMMEDPGDIEYRYTVICNVSDRGRPPVGNSKAKFPKVICEPV
jgi:hypothetical protein